MTVTVKVGVCTSEWAELKVKSGRRLAGKRRLRRRGDNEASDGPRAVGGQAGCEIGARSGVFVFYGDE